MTSDLESDYVKDQNITPTGRPITTRKKKVVNKTAKKILKKVLKRVPGPIGTVARLSGLPRKLSNAVKNAKNLKPLKKGVGFPKATKKQMASFKKAMDLKSPALKKVYEAGKKRTPAQKPGKQLNAIGRTALSKAQKKFYKNAPDNHDFQTGAFKDGLSKKHFKSIKNKVSPFDK